MSTESVDSDRDAWLSDDPSSVPNTDELTDWLGWLRERESGLKLAAEELRELLGE